MESDPFVEPIVESSAPVQSTAETSGNGGNVRRARRRWISRLALVTGVAACFATLFVLHRQKHEAAVDMNSASQFWQGYDSSAPGCLPMPSRADQYDGISDERPVHIVDDATGSASVFVIGDWGATYPSHHTFAGWGQDMWAQMTVADAFKHRAENYDPQYVLNVGDNFYVGGLEGHNCQDPPESHNRDDVIAKFQSVWVDVYKPVSHKPWISCLGNHDYGGYKMDNGWPQQIGYSFMNHNWIMPARYYQKRMAHSTFVVDYFVLDTNVYDAKPGGANPAHNICSWAHNPGSASCSNNGGPASVAACTGWFHSSWGVQQQWLEEKLAASDATWKVVVTHFPCGYESAWYKKLKAQYGLDLVVTGHRHQQELWWPGTTSKYVQGFIRTNGWDTDAPNCFVTGGGGGIVSQKFQYADYGHDLLWYGFFHLTINKDWMKIELVNTDGNIAGNLTIHPHGTEAQRAQEASWKKWSHTKAICESYCGDGNNGWEKVCGWMSCGGCEDCEKFKHGPICEDWCGDENNPWDKACGYQSCGGCEHCNPILAYHAEGGTPAPAPAGDPNPVATTSPPSTTPQPPAIPWWQIWNWR